MQVNLVDALMGSGKTTAMINHINGADEGIKFLYITPYLNEVERVIASCPTKKFKQPQVIGTKTRGIKHLFERGENIATTHALFGYFDQEIIDIASASNYVLVMDEVADVITPLKISKHDLKTILTEHTEIVDGHILRWTTENYTGEFTKHKNMCDLGCVGIYNDKAVLWLFPVSVFKGFSEVYLMTYMFSGQMQKYYFDYYGVECRNLYVKGSCVQTYCLTDEKIDYQYPKLDSLIHILDNKKLNQIGDAKESLSAAWYERNKDNVLLGLLRANVSNFFKNYAKTKSNMNIWTTFKEHEDALKGAGYAKGFLPLNTRASNEYRDRTAVAYLVNKFMNPFVKNFFTVNGITVNESAFAVSEMIQFIWRSAIRDGKEIYLYCPSSRMRELLQNWIENVSEV